MRILMITAALPPRLDGIGDYSAHLATALTEQGAAVTILNGRDDAAPIENIPIYSPFRADEPRSVANWLPEIEREMPDWILLQFNPFGYGKRGFNPWIPLTLFKIRRLFPHVRIAVMAHETFTPRTPLTFFLMRTYQYPQFRMVARAADVLFFSIQPWTDEFAAQMSGKIVQHLPIGSNIPVVETTKEKERARLQIPPDALVIGAFGTGHISRLFGLIGQTVDRIAAVEKTRPIVLLDIGPHREPIIPVQSDVSVIADGPHTPVEISRRFAAMDICLVPFADGISARRGTLMTALQHGIPVVGTTGIHTDKIFPPENERSMLLSPVSEKEQFIGNALRLVDSPELRERIGSAGKQFYGEHFEWRILAKQTLETFAYAGKTTRRN